MNYLQAVEYINSFLVFGSKLGLERIQNLLNKLGNPQDKLKFIHIAGTNGKGSICAYSSSILKNAGYKTGMFISPYILDFRERFQINGEMIKKNELAEITDYVKSVVDKMQDFEIPTEFELITAIGFLYFAKNKCDIVVLEVGLGGRFDSTNVIKTPLASVIASISLDHTAILGDTLEKIAFEKSGIIKQNGKTVMYPCDNKSVIEVVRKKSEEKNSKFVLVESAFDIVDDSIKGTKVKFNELTFTVPLLGSCQAKNAITAITAINECGLSIDNNALINGIEQTKFPARCQVISENPLIIIDGAHNPDGVKSLEKVLRDYSKKPIGIIGMMADKDVKTVISLLAPLFYEIISVPVQNERAISEKELCEISKKYCNNVKTATVEEAIEYAKESKRDFCVCGSFYLCAECYKYLK